LSSVYWYCRFIDREPRWSTTFETDYNYDLPSNSVYHNLNADDTEQTTKHSAKAFIIKWLQEGISEQLQILSNKVRTELYYYLIVDNVAVFVIDNHTF